MIINKLLHRHGKLIMYVVCRTKLETLFHFLHYLMGILKWTKVLKHQ